MGCGCVTITFCRGKHLTDAPLNRYNNVNALLGLRGKSFDKVNPGIVDEIRRLWLDYCEKVNGLSDSAAKAGSSSGEIHIKLEENGFPAIHNAPRELDKVNRWVLEDIYRDYINGHYCGSCTLILYVLTY